MLGGTVLVSFLRNLITCLGICFLFLALDKPRFSTKNTIIAYGLFLLISIALTTSWFAFARESYIIWAVPLGFIFSIAFCVSRSRATLWTSMYNLSVVFLCLTCIMMSGIWVSVTFFNNNIWVDVITRAILLAFFLWFFVVKLRPLFLFISDVMDRIGGKAFSVISLISSIALPASLLLLYADTQSTAAELYYIFVVSIVALIQYFVFKVFYNDDKLRNYKQENELAEMNSLLLKRQCEMLEQSMDDAKRIRHDARHHDMLILQYLKEDKIDELMNYLGQHEREIEQSAIKQICENLAINNILNAYISKARCLEIEVEIDVVANRNIGINDTDIVAILANIMENAIHGCLKAESSKKLIKIYITEKCGKLVISISNTAKQNILFDEGIPVSKSGKGIGVSSIIRSTLKYNGEYDFSASNGIFTCKILLKLPQ